MINYVKHSELSKDHMLETLRTLLLFGAKFNLTDSEGLSVLDYAIINNNEYIVDFILANLN